jgi:hypothetical protein
MLDCGLNNACKLSLLKSLVGGTECQHHQDVGAGPCILRNIGNIKLWIGYIYPGAKLDPLKEQAGVKLGNACLIRRKLQLNFPLFELGDYYLMS